MHVETLGDGDPELAIVAAIHGDEPCGVHAVETLLDENPSVERPVKCIVANEPALDQGVRSIDADLNRVFPGDPDADAYEQRLAADLLDELQGCRTLALHATHSTARPFAIVTETSLFAKRICPHLSIEALVEAGPCVETALGAYVPAIEVECGLQGTEQATAMARQLVSEFLHATDAIPGSDATERTLPVYRLRDHIPKRARRTYEILVTNFERVDKGAAYATIDGEPQTAEEAFYPVLMSAHGYEAQFGYAATLIDQLEPCDGTEKREGTDSMVTVASR